MPFLQHLDGWKTLVLEKVRFNHLQKTLLECVNSMWFETAFVFYWVRPYSLQEHSNINMDSSFRALFLEFDFLYFVNFNNIKRVCSRLVERRHILVWPTF